MPLVADIQMSDETFADYVDTVKVLEAKGKSRDEAVNEIVARGLKGYAKELAQFRAFAAKQADLGV